MARRDRGSPDNGQVHGAAPVGPRECSGYDEDFKDFSERRKCDSDVAAWIRKKEGDIPARWLLVRMTAPTTTCRLKTRKNKGWSCRASAVVVGPKFLDKDTGSLSGVCACLWRCTAARPSTRLH